MNRYEIYVSYRKPGGLSYGYKVIKVAESMDKALAQACVDGARDLPGYEVKAERSWSKQL